jgi:hypothetical protein
MRIGYWASSCWRTTGPGGAASSIGCATITFLQFSRFRWTSSIHILIRLLTVSAPYQFAIARELTS